VDRAFSRRHKFTLSSCHSCSCRGRATSIVLHIAILLALSAEVVCGLVFIAPGRLERSNHNMFCFVLCRLDRQVMWDGMSGEDALDVFCARQTDVSMAFLNDSGVMNGNVFGDDELEALKKMYVWREGRLVWWLKRNKFEHLPNTTRAVVFWVVLGRSGVKVTMRDVVWAGKLLRVLERLRELGGKWPRRSDKQVVMGGLKMGNLKGWLKRQMKAFEAGRLPARYRHVVGVLAREGVGF